MKSCCGKKQAKRQSLHEAIAFWFSGYLNQAFAGFFVSRSLFLAYWWITAAVVCLSFYKMKDRFFILDSFFFRVLSIPLGVFILCQVPAFWFPGVVNSVWWQGYLFYIFSMGFIYLLDQLALLKRNMTMRQQLCYHVEFCLAGCVISLLGMASAPLLLAVGGVLFLLMMTFFVRDALIQTIDQSIGFSGSLALAMGMSWGYSLMTLIRVSFFGAPVAPMFFCDCLKTVGAVLLSDWMRQRLQVQSVNPRQDKRDDYLKHVLPMVILTAYASAFLWATLHVGSSGVIALQVFSTVLICACPCVITLAGPLIDFSHALLCSGEKSFSAADWNDCLQSNLKVVTLYYVGSVFLAAGGSYWLFGAWMNPQFAGLLMLAGQTALLLNSVFQVSGKLVQVSGKSRLQVLAQHFYHGNGLNIKHSAVVLGQNLPNCSGGGICSLI